MKRLVYFTATYPFGIAGEWHRDEIEVLARVFDEILIAPLMAAETGATIQSFANIHVLPPVLTSDVFVFQRRDVLALLNRRLLPRIRELLLSPGWPSFKKLNKWAVRHLTAERILSSKVFQSEVLPKLPEAALYFFWGRGYSKVLPFLPAALQRRSAVRFHGYDLYHERDDGWIPGQRLLVEAARLLLPISAHGRDYLAHLYPDVAAKLQMHRLGCPPLEPVRRSEDGILRIVSCAAAQPVKRLHLIPQALQHCRQNIQWTHIGDGPDLPLVRELSTNLPPNIEVILRGSLPSAEVRRVYSGGMFGLFVNVSESEGIPVSIMEALAAGLPVCATDVGGTAEIVDDTVGMLLPKEFSAAQFIAALERIAGLSETGIAALRAACIRRHAENFDSRRNAQGLAADLLALCDEGAPHAA